MYSTLADILESGLTEKEVINLLNDEERDAADIDLTDDTDLIVLRAATLIEKADSFIDSHLRGRFSLPLSSTPVMIKDLSIDISIFKFFEHRHRKDMPEDLLTKMKENTKTLEKIQRGDINPGIEEAAPRADTIIKTDKSSKNKTFTDDYMGDF